MADQKQVVYEYLEALLNDSPLLDEDETGQVTDDVQSAADVQEAPEENSVIAGSTEAVTTNTMAVE
ncbi:hypothetical protein, partial [Marinobacterium sediminicola]